MKKLSKISDQIKNNTYSYTGKGSFESVVNDNKDDIIKWLENLIPLQKQIEYLNEKSGLNFQKRNYTRILTKSLENEYTEFVCVNILIRDASVIKDFYLSETDFKKLYSNLINNKSLKYPGKYDNYVEYDIFERFITVYKDDLGITISSNTNEKTIEKNTILSSDKKVNNEVPNIEKKKETNWTNLLLGKK